MSTDNSCESCEYFIPCEVKLGRRGKDGECRRYAPRPLSGGSGEGWADWEWPTVGKLEWCGEYLFDNCFPVSEEQGSQN